MTDTMMELSVGDEIEVEIYDITENRNTILREAVTQADKYGICTIGADGNIHYYSHSEVKKCVIRKTGWNFSELQDILNRLRDG